MDLIIGKAAEIAERLRDATGASWFVRAEAVAHPHRPGEAPQIIFELSTVMTRGPVIIQDFKTWPELVARADEIILKHRKF